MSYWLFSLTVMVAGFLTGFSIGAFILPIGVALIVLGPVRHHSRVFWPLMMGVVGFEIGYLLFVPLTCTAMAVIPAGADETVCTSILGPEYRASGVASPPTDLARLIGIIAAAGATFATLAWVTLAGRRDLP